ncbi:MAG TPA: ABC transporter ATP-binding protein [Methanomassiliicoccales archaeon]|nr:ABC transporter ATP-binding protein [Methanomassiliicoccales archaeon]
MENGTFVVRTHGLRKDYGEIVAVNDLCLDIPSGCIYGLIGPNGSGKTTAIKVLMGLVRATSGSAEVLGRDVPVKGKDQRVSYMPQELALYTDLTVHENVLLFAELNGLEPAHLEEREREVLEVVGLWDRKDALVGHLSGGMQHRASLACAMINEPALMFLDEPTVGVDPELRAGFWEHFRSLKAQGMTVVLTTHYMDEASRCDIVGMMHKGRLIAEGTPAELLRDSDRDNLEDAFLVFIRRCPE